MLLDLKGFLGDINGSEKILVFAVGVIAGDFRHLNLQ